MKKALRGRGNVYKRGGVWVVAVEVARDAKTGRRKKRWISGFATRKEAEEARDRARDEIRRGVDVPVNKLTVAELLERWLATKIRIADTTRVRYKGLAKMNINPYIGSIKVQQLRPAHVQALYTDLLTHGHRRKNSEEETKPLSATSVRHAHALLGAAFRWAVRMQIVPRSVVEAIGEDDIPKRAEANADALSEEEIARILDVASGSRWALPVALALATGMRRGELLALLWADVDLDTKVATVRASLSQTAAGVKRKSTKTGRVRRIPLSQFAHDLLRERRTQYLEERLARSNFDESGYVVADEFGRPYAPIQFTEAFRDIARAAGVSKRLHDLRHTAASMLLTEGVDVKTVATLLGHATPSTTLNVYSHVLAGLKESAIEKLDTRLQAAMSRKKRQ